MCSCLGDAFVCGVCGCQVAYQEFGDKTVLMHFAGHEDAPGGFEQSIWVVHRRDVCLEARRQHWALLVSNGGLGKTLV